MTCFSKSRGCIARQSICPLTGRVGRGYGPIWLDQAPAELTTLDVRKEVLLVVTPLTRSSDRFTAVTRLPEEKSTPRILAVFHAAAVSARGSTLRSCR